MKYVNIAKHNKKELPQKKPRSKFFAIFLGFVVMGVGLFMFRNDVKAIFDPVSIVANISTAHIEETDGRTNVLILGSDKRSVGSETSILTDTILMASIGRVEKDVVMISLPRDLWVESPAGYHSKINAIYAYGGAEETKSVVENVLGVPIHYYVVVDFELFREAIDILGGIEVNVENAFEDKFYPIEGKENAPLSERYETVKFEAGVQKMDGDTALKFVRSRKGDNSEGTDFARAARQQKVIMAIKNKALSLSTIVNLPKLNELYDAYSSNVDTNINLTDIQNFYLLSQQINFDKFTSVVLDDRSAAAEGGLLYAPEDTTLYEGAYVLIPRTGNFSQVHAYVQRYLFGDK